ncbi:hypothetical protein ACKFKG_30535 [Phormidesmis sp. 146-35]
MTLTAKDLEKLQSDFPRVRILINPEKSWVEIHRSKAEPVTLEDSDRLTIPDLLPGWEVEVTDLWSPEFD